MNKPWVAHPKNLKIGFFRYFIKDYFVYFFWRVETHIYKYENIVSGFVVVYRVAEPVLQDNIQIRLLTFLFILYSSSCQYISNVILNPEPGDQIRIQPLEPCLCLGYPRNGIQRHGTERIHTGNQI